MKHIFVFENSLLIVRESKMTKIKNQFQKTLNIRKQMKFNAFIFREFFHFEQMTINLITNNETILFEMKRTVQRANFA